LNNNRGNNRRRGRGNRQNGGGQQLNRIDSRARGNAPQLLEKYRKLAHDAHLNGDRVQAEYYLQFADHYFRVIADTRLRQEEQRQRRDERWQDGNEDGVEDNDFSNDGDFPTFDQPVQYQRREREDRPRREEPEATEDRKSDGESGEGSDGSGDANPYEPAENPFVRDNGRHPARGLKPRRESRRSQDNEATEADAPSALDPASLPPAISRGDRETADEGESKPRPRRRTRRPAADDTGETLEQVN
jgi:hypothetical protein